MIMSLFFPFLISFLVVLIATPPTIYLARRFKLIDDPKKHKHPAIIHKKILPRAGGLPIYLGILAGVLIFIPLTFPIINILLAGVLVVIIGLLDDRYDLSPYLRFAGNILCAALVVWGGIHIPFITNPLGGILNFSDFSYNLFGFPLTFSNIITVVWIIWIMNMLNWSKGVDGQMPGIACISAVIIGIAALRFPVLTAENFLVSEASFIVAGAALGFLFYNFYPAKIFPGYSATILGFMIGVLSIMSSAKLATAILVMGVPIADGLFTIGRRLASKHSPFWHDKGHLHHLLLERGFSQRSIAVFYWSMSALLGLFALNLSSRGKLFAIISVIVVVFAVILSLKILDKNNNAE